MGELASPMTLADWQVLASWLQGGRRSLNLRFVNDVPGVPFYQVVVTGGFTARGYGLNSTFKRLVKAIERGEA